MTHYNAIPAPLMEYNVDGTLVQQRNNGGTPFVITGDQTIDESTSTLYTYSVGSQVSNVITTMTISFAFPEVRTILGLFLFSNGTSTGGSFNLNDMTCETSVDTTDGVDGTWVAQSQPSQGSNTLGDEYRSNIMSVNFPGIRGIRFNHRVRHGTTPSGTHTHWIYTIHMYGNPDVSPVAGLEFWHPTLNQRADITHYDFGDVAAGTITPPKQLRIKNGHTQQANSVTVDATAVTAGDPMGPGVEFSLDNITYASSLNIGNIAAGAISPVFYMRRALGPAETNGPNRSRLSAIPSSWT